MLKGKCQGMGDWPGLGRILIVVSWNQNLPEVMEIFFHPCNQQTSTLLFESLEGISFFNFSTYFC